MEIDKLANLSATLKIEGIDSGGNPVKLSIAICASLPAAVTMALNRDLIEIGKENLTPYHRQQPQLRALAKMIREEKDAAEREQLHADRQTLLNRMADGLLSGRADDLAAESYWVTGRSSVAGLHREIIERAKHAGGDVDLQQLAAIVTPGSAGLVFAQLQFALGEITDPTAAT